jgi:aarF domain-containing kinase
MRRFVSLAGRATAAASLVVGAAVAFDPTSRSAVFGLGRFARASYTAAACALDTRLSRVDDQPSPAARAAAQAALDGRCASRVLSLCGALGGVYVKLAQFTSAHPALRPSLSAPLSALQDRAPPRPLAALESLLREELCGASLDAVFAAVEPAAVAAASIAQVHRAWLRDGTPVALKLQYPELRASASADLAALRALFSVAALLYDDLRYLLEMLPEFEASMRAELSFLQEARNAERMRAMAAGDARFHVPAVYGALSTDRVLVQEWVEGETLAAALRAGGALERAPAGEKRRLAAAVTDFFAQQLFVDGFVHCDPHPGNIMVARRPDGALGLSFIDWGMVRRLTPAFRRAHSELWVALLSRDARGRAAAMDALGLRSADADALSLMLTFRRAEGGGALGSALTPAQIAAMREDYKDITPADFQAFALRLPRDIFFVLRTAALVRGVNKSLGGSSRERFVSWGAGALRGARLSRTAGPLRGAAATAAAAGAGAEVEAPAGAAPVRDVAPRSASAAAAALAGALLAAVAAGGGPAAQPPPARAGGGSGGLAQPQAPGESGWATESECVRASAPPPSSLYGAAARLWEGLEVLLFRFFLWALDWRAELGAPAALPAAADAAAAGGQKGRRSKFSGEMG